MDVAYEMDGHLVYVQMIEEQLMANKVDKVWNMRMN
jgi:hypothetical protein